MNRYQTFIIIALLAYVLTDISLIIYRSYNTNLIEDESRLVVLNHEQIQDSINVIDGYNTIIIEYPQDTLELHPTYPGYIAYSYLETQPFPIDWLFTDDTKVFVELAHNYPLLGDDREKPNEYYQNIILNKIY